MDDINAVMSRMLVEAVRVGVAQSRAIIREECVRALGQSRSLNETGASVLNSKEAAELCSVKATTILRWVKTGRIVPLGGQPYRFRRSEIERARDAGVSALTGDRAAEIERREQVADRCASKFRGKAQRAKWEQVDDDA